MRSIILLLFTALICGCNTLQETRCVPFINVKDDSAFVDCITNVELVPLEESGDHLLGKVMDLQLLDDGYVLTDKRNANVFNYALDGTFRNRIGRKGRGPGEYNMISNVQTMDGKVLVFSYPDKVIFFTPTGDVLNEITDIPLGLQTIAVNSSFLTYYGYSGERSYRAAFIHENGDTKKYLDVEIPLMALSLENNIFSESNQDGIFFTDSYNPTVHRYRDGLFEPVFTVDFGKYSIGEKFFKYKDVFQGAEYLMSSNYGLILSYFFGTPYSLIQVNIKDSSYDRGMTRYALMDNESGSCRWFGLARYDSDEDIVGPFKLFAGNTLYALISPEKSEILSDGFVSKIINPEIMAFSKEADCYMIAKIRLD